MRVPRLVGLDDPARRDVPRDRRRLLIEDPHTEFLLAGDAGVAQLRYRLSAWTGVEDCWLEDLFVRDSARGTGLGRALVRRRCSRARARGCRRIELDVQETNAARDRPLRALRLLLDPQGRRPHAVPQLQAAE